MVSEEKTFENDDGRTTDGRTTDDGVTGILIAHLGAFGLGELKNSGLNAALELCQKGDFSPEKRMKDIV